MTTACVLFANGFEEIEAMTVVDVLRRAEIDTVMVGVGALQIEGAHGVRVTADRLLDEAIDQEWDVVILPGGMPGAAHLRDDAQVQALVKRQHSRGKPLGAICAAPIALAKAGVLEGKRAVCYPGFENQLGPVAPGGEGDVLVDGHVTTSRGPGTAMAFALRLVETLRGVDVSRAVARGMLIPAS